MLIASPNIQAAVTAAEAARDAAIAARVAAEAAAALASTYASAAVQTEAQTAKLAAQAAQTAAELAEANAEAAQAAAEAAVANLDTAAASAAAAIASLAATVPDAPGFYASAALGLNDTATNDLFWTSVAGVPTLYRNADGVAVAIDADLAGIADLAGDYTSYLAMDFQTEGAVEVKVVDAATPANDYEGSARGYFATTVWPSARLCVQADGTLKWQGQNGMPYSGEFSGVNWTKVNATVTASQTGPDGVTADGSLVAATGVTCSVRRQSSAQTTAVNGVTSAGVYAKAGTCSIIYLEWGDGTAHRAWFNLGTGAVGTVTAGITASIHTTHPDGTALPTGWYHCVVTRTGTAIVNPTLWVALADADNSTAVTSGNDVTVARAAAWRGVRRVDYIVNTGAVAVLGPAYDWTHGHRAVLLEMQTNYRSLWADDLTNAAWVLTGCTTALDATGPHSEPCSTVTATAAAATAIQTTLTAATLHTVTLWAKRKTGTGAVSIVLNGVDTEIALTTSWQKFTAGYSGASAVATFGIKLATSGDEVYVSLLKVADQSTATSDVALYDVVGLQRSKDSMDLALTGLPSGAEMTLYADITMHGPFVGAPQQDMRVGYQTGATTPLGHVRLLAAAWYMYSGDGTNTTAETALYDRTVDERTEITLRYDASNMAASINGRGAQYDHRQSLLATPGKLLLEATAHGRMWLRRLLHVPELVADNDIERWRYSEETRDPRYLDDVQVSRFQEVADGEKQREPTLCLFWDDDVSAGGVVMFRERSSVSSVHTEYPTRARMRRWEVDRATNRISMEPVTTLIEQAGYATGTGGVAPSTLKQTIGSEMGRVWVLYHQVDSASGEITPTDHRRIYAVYSDDNLVTLSSPELILDYGVGTAIWLNPSSNYVELPHDAAFPGRLILPFFTTFGGSWTVGLLYRDPGGSWTVGATLLVTGATEWTLARRPNGTLLMTGRDETDDEHWQMLAHANGTSFLTTPALITAGEFTNCAQSLLQMDPGGTRGVYGRTVQWGARKDLRKSLTFEFMVGQPVVPEGIQFVPHGIARVGGYCSAVKLSGNRVLAAYESPLNTQFNVYNHIRMMLVDLTSMI